MRRKRDNSTPGITGFRGRDVSRLADVRVRVVSVGIAISAALVVAGSIGIALTPTSETRALPTSVRVAVICFTFAWGVAGLIAVALASDSGDEK